MFEYRTQGVCARKINFKVEDDIVKSVEFEGGCDGSLHGITQLVEGLEIDQVIQRLSGITCGRKATSCPDQLTKALLELKKQEKTA